MFFDNVYAYGRVEGAMAEDTAFNPISKKVEIRAKIATMLLEEMDNGNLRAMIARSADFYGPDIESAYGLQATPYSQGIRKSLHLDGRNRA